MTVSSTVARNIDTCNGVTTVRTIPYKLLDATHVNVYRYTIATGAVSAALTLNVDYTIQNVGADNAQYTMASADSSAYKLINIRNVPFSQAADYVQNDSFPAETHEAALDKLTMIAQQMQDTMKRAASLPLFADPALVVTLPIPVDGYGLIWSGTGGTIVNTSVSLATLQTQAALLAGIASDITNVSSISANVVSVDGNSANINTVAGLSAKITTLAAISTAITGVNAIAAAVSTVSGISANVTTVAGVSTAVTTVAGISAAVSTVSGISANVTTVAGVAAGITTLSPIAANITTVAGISANVTTVAGVSANVTSVAGALTNINLVAAALTNINSVATDLTNINAVQADLTNIDTCAANIAAINAAPAAATAAAASAAAAAASASGISMRGSCRVASTTALTVTYANGTLGVGATLTNATTQAAFAMDGVTLAVGERILIKDQASGLQNGMYTLTVAGSGATNWVLTRATDYDEASEVVEGTATIIEEGTSNASHIYVMTHHGAITMGTTSIDFTSLSATATSANTLTTPRAIYGNNFDGSAALNQIIASTYGGTGNGFTKFSGPTTSEKTYSLPDATTTILTTNAAVTAAQGGTGQTSYTDGQLLIGNTSTGFLSKATLTQGSNITITNGNGTITIAAASGGASKLDDLSDVLYDTATLHNLSVGTDTAFVAGVTNNVFVGQTAGNPSGMTTGASSNVGVGYTTAHALTSGTSNVAIGAEAMYAATTCANSVAVGYQALRNGTNAGSCVAVGQGSLASATGSSNTGLGNSAGQTVTSGTNNVCLGASSDVSASGASNQIAIGASAACLGDNQANIGNSSTTVLTVGTSNTASIKALNVPKMYIKSTGATGARVNAGSFNVTSITDTGAGDFSAVTTTNFADTNYCISLTAELTATTYAVANDRKMYVRNGGSSASTIRMNCIDSTATTNLVKDPTSWHCSALGKQ